LKVCLWCNRLRQRYEFLPGRPWNDGLFPVCCGCLKRFYNLVNSLNVGCAIVILENGLINVVVRRLEVKREKLEK